MINIKQETKEEWRELGFFYDYNKANQEWLLIGSRNGLLNFSNLLDEYISKPRNEKLGEHEHFFPYMYLTVVTSNETKITDYGIFGSLVDLERLANIIKEKLIDSTVGNVFQIDSEYSKSNEAKLVFEIREKNFDPASADNFLWLNKK
ncbi:MAG: hypothetical protein M3388_01640 [Acidobacteriota bacterium]|nr:hypothetical protein [Acidobacteriota bacterium]